MSEICATCGLPKELCVCETIAKEAQEIYITETKKRFGKVSTLVEGIDGREINIKDLAKKLKNKFACGGTAKGGKIELQGKHTEKVKEELIRLGFSPIMIKVRKL